MTIMRTFNTTNELRQYYKALEEGFKPRAKRNYKHLPNNRRNIARDISRSWKDYRKNQYK